jgi:hypothetical protein
MHDIENGQMALAMQAGNVTWAAIVEVERRVDGWYVRPPQCAWMGPWDTYRDAVIYSRLVFSVD